MVGVGDRSGGGVAFSIILRGPDPCFVLPSILTVKLWTTSSSRTVPTCTRTTIRFVCRLRQRRSTAPIYSSGAAFTLRHPIHPSMQRTFRASSSPGIIDEVGAGVSRWRSGERVFGLVPGGGYASQIVTHPALVARVPDQLDTTSSAAVPEAFITAFDALILQAALTAGERVLIHAVASGVGTAALQIARVYGAEVAGSAGSRQKLTRVAEIAPFFGINYRETDFKEALESEFGERAINVILDVVGAPYWRRNLELLAVKGRLVLVGRMGGSEAETPLELLMTKRLRIHGTVMRARSLEDKIAVTRAFEGQLLPFFERGELTPVVDHVYPIHDIHKATARMENNENVGKIVLTFPE